MLIWVVSRARIAGAGMEGGSELVAWVCSECHPAGNRPYNQDLPLQAHLWRGWHRNACSAERGRLRGNMWIIKVTVGPLSTSGKRNSISCWTEMAHCVTKIGTIR